MSLISYLTGISNAIYAFTCLMCGLQLCCGVFTQRQHANTYLSRILGICLIALSVSAVCYLLSDLLEELRLLYRVGESIDILLCIGYTMVGYALYTNNEPSRTRLIALASPFVLISILNICQPAWMDILFIVAVAILFAYYVYFGVGLQRRERMLDDLYSDPESHSLRWIWTTIGLFVGWWLIGGVFQLAEFLQPWYNAAVFAYMTGLFLFVFTKVSNYKEPVSLATQQQMENVNANENVNQLTGDNNVVRLRSLMEQEQLYLNPDLTVEDVVKRLGTNTKYFSQMLHSEMHTSFSQLVNEYRVARAKDLLEHTDTKVECIGESCGFNSRQSFHRVFVKFTGSTPAEWRENC